MQLPSIDQTLYLRPVSAELASMAGSKVIPVAPVNPSAHVTPVAEPTPSVINLVNQANKPSTGEGVYTSVSDPARPGSEAATVGKDWTIHRPVTEIVEDPPPVPLSKLLIDHIKSIWAASASAIQVEQVKNQLDLSQTKPVSAPGVLAKEVLTYSPSKINKTENI
jgi:hypothetical protein